MPFSDACIAKGVQPIIGAMLGVARPARRSAAQAAIDWLVLLAKDEQGYANLCKLVSVGASRPAGRAGAACRVRQRSKG